MLRFSHTRNCWEALGRLDKTWRAVKVESARWLFDRGWEVVIFD